MKTTALISMAMTSILVSGCGTIDDSDLSDTDLVSLDEKADVAAGAKAILPPGSAHIYFTTVADAYVEDTAPLAYRWFTANGGTEFKVGVSETDETTGLPVAGEHIGFKLQRAVKKHNKWSWSVVAQADGADGFAGVKYTPSTGPGLYLVTATASPLPASLRITVGCGGSNCATAKQPGDSCGGHTINHTACDSGLFCNYALDAQCGAADQTGTCTVIPSICPRGIRYNPVCGCDGKTHDGTCGANADGTSVQRTGSCDVNLVGGWSYVDGSHYDYTFNADGTFTSVQQPACAFTTPRCYVKLALNQGNYYISGQSVSLYYTSDFHQPQSATFAITKNHLTGSDFGISLDLTRQ